MQGLRGIICMFSRTNSVNIYLRCGWNLLKLMGRKYSSRISSTRCWCYRFWSCSKISTNCFSITRVTRYVHCKIGWHGCQVCRDGEKWKWKFTSSHPRSSSRSRSRWTTAVTGAGCDLGRGGTGGCGDPPHRLAVSVSLLFQGDQQG